MALEEELELKIRGMTCDSCAFHVEEALISVDGVKHVEVPGWKSGQAKVLAAAGTETEALIESVHQAGYSAKIKRRTSINQNEQIPHYKNSGDNQPELMIIGGGSAGFAAAIKGAELGFEVVLVEASTMGGTCVNVGCVPSKTLIRSVEHYHLAKQKTFRGVHTSSKRIDWSTVVAQKDELVAELRKAKYEDVLAAYPQIKYFNAHARLKSKGVEIDGETYFPRKIVIATGAKPWAPPIPGLDELDYLTSTTAMELKTLPKSMIVLGANAVGLELAQVFARAGTQITILEVLPQIASNTDKEISGALRDYLEAEGLRIVNGFQTTYVAKKNGMYSLAGNQNGGEITFKAEQLMVATGRRPTTAGLGLEEAGVKTGSRGEILVDDKMQSSNPNVYAAGDVTGQDQFVYVAAYGAALAVENALTNTGKIYDADYIPRVIFTDPQVATAGLTEEQAREKGYKVKVSTLAMEHVPRALAARDTRGAVKLVADADTDQLLGAHILAPGASEMIQIAVLGLRFSLKVKDIRETIFPYLTNSEAIKLAALTFDKEVAKLSCCAG